MNVRLPDGTIIQNVPDGTTKADLAAKLQNNGMAVPSEWLQSAPQAKPVHDAGESLNRGLSDIPRQLGLTARYALEGPAQAAQLVTEPIAGLMRMGGIKTRPLGEIASGFANAIGLPSPESSQERVVGDATRLLAGSGATMGAAGAASALPGMAGKAGAFLAANPMQQASAAVGAGGMGGLSREGGGSPLQQAGASLIGGVLGGMAPGAVQGMANAGKRLMPQNTQALDVQIERILAQTGQDYAQVPVAVKQALRAELSGSLRAGREVSPEAVRRLADFKTIGATPTRGMVSQNPVQITKEMNLAKMGANSSDEGLQGLAMVQNRNNNRLIGALNENGAARGDAHRAGMNVIDSIGAKDARMNQDVSALYQQARDTSGRSAQLDGADFTRKASQALDEGLLGGALPKDVENHLNRIAMGEVPFDVNYAEQLKTRIGALQRATSDGSARMALGTVRRALDDTQLLNQAPRVNPGNLPAVAGTVPPSPAALGQESIAAFNEARQAARQRFGWQESAKPIEAALNGMEPDKFVQKFVLNGTLADAQAVANNAPQAGVKDAILAHLKEKALNGAADEVGKFSQSAFNKALNQIGDRKLSVFFSPEELNQIRTIGRVASYMQTQPVGSAVNNSNSGALLLGRGIDLLNKIPAGKTLLGDPLQSINLSIQQRAAQNIAPGLLQATEKLPFYRGLLAPGLATGGLLSAPSGN